MLPLASAPALLLMLWILFSASYLADVQSEHEFLIRVGVSIELGFIVEK